MRDDQGLRVDSGVSKLSFSREDRKQIEEALLVWVDQNGVERLKVESSLDTLRLRPLLLEEGLKQ